MKYNGTGIYHCNPECKGCRPLALSKEQFRALIESLRDAGKTRLALKVLRLEKVVVPCSQTQGYAFFPAPPDEFRKQGDI